MAKKKDASVKILVFQAHSETLYWVVDTDERQAAALHEMFGILDEQGCYEEDECSQDIRAARDGDANAIQRVLIRRRDCDSESWHIQEAVDPLCN